MNVIHRTLEDSTTHIGIRQNEDLAGNLPSIAATTVPSKCCRSLQHRSRDRRLLQKGDRVDFASHLTTTGRRLAPSPQLIMSPKSLYEIHKATCVCKHDQAKRWSCTADLPKKYKWGSIEVNCEGFDWRDDPYILKGSCLLRYTIVKRLTFVEGIIQLLVLMLTFYFAPSWLRPLLGILWILSRLAPSRTRGGKYRARGRGTGTRR